MQPDDFLTELKAAEPLRDQRVTVDGHEIPASAKHLMDRLGGETDPDRRWGLYSLIDFELSLAHEVGFRLTVAEKRLEEFQDGHAELDLARAYLAAGDPKAAIEHGKRAMRRDLSTNGLVNDTAISNVRIALDAQDVMAVEAAIVELLRHFRLGKQGDLRLETDWTPQAEQLGVDAELIEAVQNLAWVEWVIGKHLIGSGDARDDTSEPQPD